MHTRPIGASVAGPAASALLVWILAAGAGCVTENPNIRAVPEPAADVRPTSVQLFASAPRDTNGNGYVDRFGVTLYLFNEQRSVVPLSADGTFTFTLAKPGGAVMTKWVMTTEQTRAALKKMPPGPGYVFTLSVLDHMSDAVEYQAVDLTAEFTPTGGKPVASAGGAALRLGRVSM